MPKSKTAKVTDIQEGDLEIDTNSKVINDDNHKITKEMNYWIEKKKLSEKEYDKMREQLTYPEMIIVFRQKALRKLGEEIKERFPNSFKKSDLVKIQNVHNTRHRADQIKLVEKVRQEERSTEFKGKLRKSTRLNKEQEKNELDGYTIN
jgi:hypothetical protein